MSSSAAPIPGNEAAFTRLREVLQEGSAFAFVGAGASAGLYPLWPQLLKKLADRALSEGFTDEADRDFWLTIKSAQDAAQRIAKRFPDFHNVLREIFQPILDADGKPRFTRVHAALVRLPFRGIVTTNYDTALLEARHEVRRDMNRTDATTWKDGDAVRLWHTDEIFKTQKLPVLFAHGIYNRKDTIVLTTEQYDQAYSEGPYLHLFNKLWSQECLVFVGFGFSDPWLDYVTHKHLLHTGAAGERRHIAIVGIEESDRYSPEMRRSFAERYGASVYIYRIHKFSDGTPDHGELAELLESLIGGAAPVQKKNAP